MPRNRRSKAAAAPFLRAGSRWSVAVLTALMACTGDQAAPDAHGAARRFLYAWSWDSDEQSSDFLAVLDADSGSPAYGRLLTTVAVGTTGRAHHTEHVMPPGQVFFANSFDAGRTFLFDVSDPIHPAVAGTFGARAGYTYPHSFVRLPSGHVLATFQNEGAGNRRPGGLVELDGQGRLVRAGGAADAADPGIRPYSLAVVPALDRVVSTTTDMRTAVVAHSIQVWRLSDLRLIRTIILPAGTRGDEQYLPAEPRVLADGATVVVNTFTCGLYLVEGLDTDTPSARWIHTFAFRPPRETCALPVVMGRYWIQTVPAAEGLVALDMTVPATPRVVQRLTLGREFRPHWMSADPVEPRVVVTGRGAMRHRVMIVDVDTTTGRLAVDSTFRVSFDRERWPHGATGAATPHAVLFSR